MRFVENLRSSIFQIGQAIFSKKIKPMSEKIIFHYTNEVGLQGILQNKFLWATDVFASNDASEIILGQRFFRRDLEEWVKQKNRKEDDLKFLFQGASEMSEGVFFTCFSTVKNYNENDRKYILDHGLLSQWRGYGSYAIKFKKDVLLKALKEWELNDGDPILIVNLDDEVRYFSEADYRKFKKDKLLKQKIDEFKKSVSIDEWQEIEKNMENDESLSKAECDEISKRIKLSLIPRFFVKHRGFYEEREVRAVVIVPKNCITKKIHFHAPYKSHIKLFEEDPSIIENAIEEIIIGPVRDQKAANLWINSMLKEFGYQNVKVKCSEIPFRRF
jgi:hypothetical protein